MSKPKKQKSPSEPKPAGALSRFQAFTTETIHRSQIKGAEYNPRFLSDRARVKLKEALSRVGLVQPIVWNKRSGNIVGGHQRISQLDSLEGSSDYSLTVAVLDVDTAREKELNVLLNNPDVCGDWDLEKLQALLTSEIDLLNTGFDEAEFFKMFGEAASQPDNEPQEELAKQLAGVKDAYDKLTKAHLHMDDQDFYSVIVFGSHAERKDFLDEFGFEDNRYLDGRTLTVVLRDLKAENAKLAGTAHKRKRLGAGEDVAPRPKKPA